MLTGLGSGIWELAIKSRGDAYRVVYALQLGENIWIVHAFQKKSKKGIATPKVSISNFLRGRSTGADERRIHISAVENGDGRACYPGATRSESIKRVVRLTY